MAENGHISKEQQDAYNAAVAAVQAATYTYDPGADQYFQDQADQAMDEVSEMIDTYVEAAQFRSLWLLGQRNGAGRADCGRMKEKLWPCKSLWAQMTCASR
jgi:hypothetical protein